MHEVTLFLNNIDFNWSVIESAAVFFSILYVILAVKENIWCWGAGAISVSIYIYICFFSQLYAETGLQVFYLLMSLYGYYSWSKKESSLKISDWSIRKHLIILLLGTVLTFIMGFYFTIYTSAKMPIIDSFTTVFSIFATYMATKKIIGNWLYWIIIDIVSIYLYFSRDLHLTSILFLAYAIIAIFGYFSWTKKMELDE